MAKGKSRPASPERQIKISGNTYTLRFSIKAMAALQDHYAAASLDEVGRRLADAATFGAGDLVAVLWAGLRSKHEDISLEDCWDLLDEAGLEEVQSVIGDAFAGAAEEAAEGNPPKAAKPGPSTGS